MEGCMLELPECVRVRRGEALGGQPREATVSCAIIAQ